MSTTTAVVEPSIVIEECDLSFILIGERLRELRLAKKLSRRDLQESCGISRFQTSRIENGYGIPDVEILRQYARAFQVPLSALLYDGDTPSDVDGDALRQLRQFAKAYSCLRRNERNLLRSIVRRMVEKGAQAAAYTEKAS